MADLGDVLKPFVLPLVTLLEKLDALHRRVPNEKSEPPDFVRHF